MTKHHDFLRGFGNALGMTDCDEIQSHYEAWLQSTGMNDVERIDYESGGYQTGFETGRRIHERFSELQ